MKSCGFILLFVTLLLAVGYLARVHILNLIGLWVMDNFFFVAYLFAGIYWLFIFGIVSLPSIVAYFVGRWFSCWYLKRERINKSLIKIIAWANLIT